MVVTDKVIEIRSPVRLGECGQRPHRTLRDEKKFFCFFFIMTGDAYMK